MPSYQKTIPCDNEYSENSHMIRSSFTRIPIQCLCFNLKWTWNWSCMEDLRALHSFLYMEHEKTRSEQIVWLSKSALGQHLLFAQDNIMASWYYLMLSSLSGTYDSIWKRFQEPFGFDWYMFDFNQTKFKHESRLRT